MTPNTSISALILSEYDQIHAAARGETLTLAQARDAMTPAVVAYLEQADRDHEAEARMLIDAALRRERPRRANQLRRDLDYIIEYFTDPEAAAIGVEAMLGRAYPLGTTSGEDRALAHWTMEDLRNVVVSRYREAAAATEAARALDESVERLIERMAATGHMTLGEAIGSVSLRASA